MATPPRHWTAEQALATIATTRRDVDDPDRWRLDEDNLYQVAAYVRAHPIRGMSRRQQQAEVLAVLKLRVVAWWQWEGLTLWALRRAADLAIGWRQVAEVFGLRTRQAVADLRDRKEGLFGPDHTPSEKVGRRQRRAARAVPDDPRTTWLAAHREELHDLARRVLHLRDLATDPEWMDMLAAEVQDAAAPPTGATVGVLHGAATELPSTPVTRPLVERVTALNLEWGRLSRP